MYPRFKLSVVVLALASMHDVLAQSVSENEPIIVTATRIPGAAASPAVDAVVVREDRIRQQAGRSVSDVLAQDAGVEVYSNGGPTTISGVFIRGTQPAQNILLIDGFKFINPTDGKAPIDQIPLAMLDRIEVIRGASSGLYGSGAIGGVMQLFSKLPDRTPALDASLTYGRYGTYRGDVGYGGRNGATQYYIGVSADGSEGFSATRPGTFVFEPDRDGYRRQAIFGKVAHSFENGNELKINTFSVHTRTEFDSGNASPPWPYQKTESALLGANYTAHLSDTWRAEFKLGETDYQYDFRDTGYTFSPRITNRQSGWLNYWSLPVGTLTLGVEQELQKVHGDGLLYEKRREIDSLLVQWLAKIDAHQIQANLRKDRWTDYGPQTTGGLSYAYSVSRDWALTASLARAFRAPTFDDLYFPAPWGNPGLKPEHARTWETGLRYRNGPDEARLIAFNNRIHDAIELDSSFKPENVEAKISGGTASWRHSTAGWTWNLSYTYQDARDALTDQRLIRRGKNIVSGMLERDWGQWRVGAEARGQDGRYDNINNAPSNHLGGYGLLNLYANYAIDRQWSAQLRVDNALNKRYELAKYYNTAGSAAFLTVRYTPLQ